MPSKLTATPTGPVKSKSFRTQHPALSTFTSTGVGTPAGISTRVSFAKSLLPTSRLGVQTGMVMLVVVLVVVLVEVLVVLLVVVLVVVLVEVLVVVLVEVLVVLLVVVTGSGAGRGTGSGAGRGTGSDDGSGPRTIRMVGFVATVATPPTPAWMCCRAMVL